MAGPKSYGGTLLESICCVESTCHLPCSQLQFENLKYQHYDSKMLRIEVPGTCYLLPCFSIWIIFESYMLVPGTGTTRLVPGTLRYGIQLHHCATITIRKKESFTVGGSFSIECILEATEMVLGAGSRDASCWLVSTTVEQYCTYVVACILSTYICKYVCTYVPMCIL